VLGGSGMSSIFDNVEMSTSRRKAKVLDTPHPKSLFVDKVWPASHAVAVEKPPDTSIPVSGSEATSPSLLPGTVPADSKIDVIWGICVFFALFPVTYTMYKTVSTPAFDARMLVIPYECTFFYLGIFFGLPGVTVHIFCLSLIFSKTCLSGVFLSILSIFLMIVTVEQACMAEPAVSVDVTFYMFALSTCCGLCSQTLFVSILYKQLHQKTVYTCILGVGGVLVTLSVLAILLSALNAETPHTKSTVLIRTLPLSAAVVIHAVSSYWTMYPVRIVCNNM